jgi:hypothetical protein
MARLPVTQIAVEALRLTAVVRKMFLEGKAREGGTVAAATLQRVAHKQR